MGSDAQLADRTELVLGLTEVANLYISELHVTFACFETGAPNDLKMTLNTTRSKVHQICVPGPKFHSVLLHDAPF